MKPLLFLLIALPLAAQEPAPQEQNKPAGQEQQQAPAKTEEQQKEPANPAEAAAKAEKWLTGDIDFGERFITGLKGDYNTYRSVVNLQEGFRLLGVDLTLREPSRKLFDRIDFRMNNWGDPYNTAQIYAFKERAYRLNVDYRNIQYFNFLPSFADPLLARGIVLDERGFDTYRRDTDVNLELLPGRRIIPYLAFNGNSGSGSGTTVFDLASVNEFPVPNRFADRSNNYRGGVRFEFNRFHATLEQGGITYREDQEASSSGSNTGNNWVPIFGQRTFLNNLDQAWGVRGDSIYTRGMMTANPVSWADFTGQFLFSQPHTDVQYSQANTGNFFLPSVFQFYNGQFALLNSTATQPHSSGGVTAEVRPLKGLRVVESWMTDRLHNAAGALLAESFLLTGQTINATNLAAADRLVMNYNQQELNLIYEFPKWVTVRAGHRYVWGDTSNRTGVVNPLPGIEIGKLSQNVALFGASLRLSQKLSASAEFEDAVADRAYFRTSLYNYERAKAMIRYQLLPTLTLSSNFTLLHNENPEPGINYHFTSRNNSISIAWTPANSKWVALIGDYTRSTLRSDMFIVDPSFLTLSDKSWYRDNAHTGTALVDLTLPTPAVFRPKVSLGGSFFTSSGSRPTQYYQPTARVSLPIGTHAQFNTEWRWYSMHQPFYFYEGFQTHEFMTALRFRM